MNLLIRGTFIHAATFHKKPGPILFSEKLVLAGKPAATFANLTSTLLTSMRNSMFSMNARCSIFLRFYNGFKAENQDGE